MLDGMQELVRDFDADRSKLHLQTAEYVRLICLPLLVLPAHVQAMLHCVACNRTARISSVFLNDISTCTCTPPLTCSCYDDRPQCTGPLGDSCTWLCYGPTTFANTLRICIAERRNSTSGAADPGGRGTECNAKAATSTQRPAADGGPTEDSTFAA
jgi:hypothetical protein